MVFLRGTLNIERTWVKLMPPPPPPTRHYTDNGLFKGQSVQFLTVTVTYRELYIGHIIHFCSVYYATTFLRNVHVQKGMQGIGHSPNSLVHMFVVK